MRALVAGSIVLTASFVNFLTFYSYPLLTYEVGILIAGALALAAAVALLYSGQRFWGRAVLDAMLLFLIIDLHFDRPYIAALACVAVLGVLFLKKASLLPLFTISGTIVFAASIFGLSERREWIETHKGTQSGPRVQRPAIIHLLLDEQIGIRGAALGRGGMGNSEDVLRNSYLSNGFTVYERAYARHIQTINSIPDILNLGGPSSATGSKRGAVMGQNQYFRALISEGYQLKILQSDFLDYCARAVYASCTSYLSPSPQLLPRFLPDAADRTVLLLYKFVSLSDALARATTAYKVTARLLGRRGKMLLAKRGQRTNTIAAYAAMERLKHELKSAQMGEVYFAHLLLPHDPYIFDSNCKVRPRSDWLYRHAGVSLPARERAYAEQMSCTTKKVGELLKVLASTPAGRNAIVIVHGDHGSRIVTVEPLTSSIGQFTQADLVAGFSTLFAIRLPGQDGRVVSTPVSVPTVLKSVLASDFAAAKDPVSSEQTGRVFISDDDWRPAAKTTLPREWLGTGKNPN